MVRPAWARAVERWTAWRARFTSFLIELSLIPAPAQLDLVDFNLIYAEHYTGGTFTKSQLKGDGQFRKVHK